MLKHAGTIEEHIGEDDSTQWLDARSFKRELQEEALRKR